MSPVWLRRSASWVVGPLLLLNTLTFMAMLGKAFAVHYRLCLLLVALYLLSAALRRLHERLLTQADEQEVAAGKRDRDQYGELLRLPPHRRHRGRQAQG